MRRFLYIVPLALFIALVVYFFAAMRGGYDPGTLPSAMIGKPVPAFDLPGPLVPPNFAGVSLQPRFQVLVCGHRRVPTHAHLYGDQSERL